LHHKFRKETHDTRCDQISLQYIRLFDMKAEQKEMEKIDRGQNLQSNTDIKQLTSKSMIKTQTSKKHRKQPIKSISRKM